VSASVVLWTSVCFRLIEFALQGAHRSVADETGQQGAELLLSTFCCADGVFRLFSSVGFLRSRVQPERGDGW
jgi:hypothetical protein